MPDDCYVNRYHGSFEVEVARRKFPYQSTEPIKSQQDESEYFKYCHRRGNVPYYVLLLDSSFRLVLFITIII